MQLKSGEGRVGPKRAVCSVAHAKWPLPEGVFYIVPSNRV